MTLNPKYLRGCVLAFDFAELQGDTVYDLSGNGNNGTIYGASWRRGHLVGALEFDGEDDYVEVSNTVIPPDSYELSVEVWFKLISTGDEVRVIVKQGIGTHYGFWAIYTQYSDWLRFQLRGTDGTYSTALNVPGIEVGNWYHAVGVKTSDEIRLYVNGELKAFDSFDKPVGVEEPTRIGYDPTWYYPLNGFIGFVRIYNRALTEKEIREHYYYVKNMISKPRFPIFYKHRRTKFVPSLA